MRNRMFVLCALVLTAVFFVLGVEPTLASRGDALVSNSTPTGGVQAEVQYYTKNVNDSFIRSDTPFATGVATQVDNTDGSVTLDINGTSAYADSGFVVYAGRLGDLKGIVLSGTGSSFGMNLWFDVDKDGEFFAWSNNVLTGLAGDTYGLGPSSQGGALVVDGGSTFFMMNGTGSPTLAQLQAGAVPGIPADTQIAIWVGVNTDSGSLSATITSLTVNPCAFAVDPVNKTSTLLADCTTDHTLHVADGWTLDGAGRTITGIDPVGGHFVGAVIANGGSSATVQNLVVTVSGLTNICDDGNNRLRGILFDDASGSILNNTVIHINQGASGCQEGNGIEVRNFTSSTQRSVTISGNTVTDYQKNGITANGAVAATITNNTVEGAGPVDYIAQNGIQVGYGATAMVVGDSVSGNNYTPKSWVACGILYYQASGVKASSNNLFANERDLCNFGKGGGQFNPTP